MCSFIIKIFRTFNKVLKWINMIYYRTKIDQNKYYNFNLKKNIYTLNNITIYSINDKYKIF